MWDSIDIWLARDRLVCVIVFRSLALTPGLLPPLVRFVDVDILLFGLPLARFEPQNFFATVLERVLSVSA